jgi:hypothetical protein
MVVVKNGVNRAEIDGAEVFTIAELYERAKDLLNIGYTDNLNISINNGSVRSYGSIESTEVTNGDVVEFIKAAGTKGC